jgi:hypothetical protein
MKKNILMWSIFQLVLTTIIFNFEIALVIQIYFSVIYDFVGGIELNNEHVMIILILTLLVIFIPPIYAALITILCIIIYKLGKYDGRNYVDTCATINKKCNC